MNGKKYILFYAVMISVGIFTIERFFDLYESYGLGGLLALFCSFVVGYFLIRGESK